VATVNGSGKTHYKAAVQMADGRAFDCAAEGGKAV